MNVRVDLTERIAWITLDRPPLNVLDIATLSELEKVARELAQNDECTIAVIAGAGEKAFSAGVEIKEHTPDLAPKMIQAFHSALRALVAMPQVTVAAVDGAALGGGLEVAMVCDMVVASKRSTLGVPEIKLACFPPAAIAMLPGICGRPMASDLVLSGTSLTAERAQAVGLVSRIFDDARFDEELRAMVADLASRSPAVLRLTAQTLRRRLLAGFESALAEVEQVYLQKLLKEPDMTEAITAFGEKRKPVWRS